jgi:hypothetical protein
LRLYNISTMHGHRARARQLLPAKYAIPAATRAASTEEVARALSILSDFLSGLRVNCPTTNKLCVAAPAVRRGLLLSAPRCVDAQTRSASMSTSALLIGSILDPRLISSAMSLRSWRALRESNPCFRRERAMSWTARRRAQWNAPMSAQSARDIKSFGFRRNRASREIAG